MFIVTILHNFIQNLTRADLVTHLLIGSGQINLGRDFLMELSGIYRSIIKSGHCVRRRADIVHIQTDVGKVDFRCMGSRFFLNLIQREIEHEFHALILICRRGDSFLWLLFWFRSRGHVENKIIKVRQSLCFSRLDFCCNLSRFGGIF